MSAFKRLIGCLFLKGGRVVQSIGFRRYLPVGRPEIAARYLDSWGIDELALIDMDARREGRLIALDIVERVSDNIFVPLTVGGGIVSTADIRSLLSVGADKVVANRAFFDDRKLVRDAAEMFGNQCVVASVDARRNAAGGYEVMLDNATTGTGVTPWDLAIMSARRSKSMPRRPRQISGITPSTQSLSSRRSRRGRLRCVAAPR
jgi:cyclase